MSFSARLLFLSFGLVFLACSPKPAAKCAETCSGCCDAAEVCQPGNVITACGTQGFLCQACPSNMRCDFGACVPTSCQASAG